MIYSEGASACPDGQYNQCGGPSWARLCGCLPNSRTVGQAVNPLPDVLTTVNGAVHGNINEISKGLGGYMLKNTDPAVAIVALTVLDQNTKEFAQQVIGRGFILYVSGVDPELIVVDAVGNIIDHFNMPNPPANPIAAAIATPEPRESQSFRASKAICLVSNKDGSLVGGWIAMPSLTNVQSGETKDLLTSDIRPNDLIEIDADPCTFEDQGHGAQSGIAHARMLFQRPDMRVGSAPGQHFFLLGLTAK
jgi:hypothetical protein